MKRLACTAAAVIALVLGGCGGEPEEAGEAAARPDGAIDVQQEAQRIQVGMTEADVIRILGEPRTRVKETAGDRLTFWTFNDQKRITARVYVTIDGQGKVADVETIPL